MKVVSTFLALGSLFYAFSSLAKASEYLASFQQHFSPPDVASMIFYLTESLVFGMVTIIFVLFNISISLNAEKNSSEEATQ